MLTKWSKILFFVFVGIYLAGKSFYNYFVFDMLVHYSVYALIIAFFLCAIPFLNAFCFLFIVFKYSQENEYLIEKRQKTANFINSILNYKIK